MAPSHFITKSLENPKEWKCNSNVDLQFAKNFKSLIARMGSARYIVSSKISPPTPSLLQDLSFSDPKHNTTQHPIQTLALWYSPHQNQSNPRVGAYKKNTQNSEGKMTDQN
nr:hypothetical protein Iba_chr04aCG25340 [Ipomoea batatas]